MGGTPTNHPKQESLDEIVTRSAAAIADQIRGAAALAKSEMDLQIDVAAALKKFAGDAKITLEGHHNVTIATGRPDSVYGSVIVEYKEPGNLSPNKDAANNKKVIDQLKKRFYDMNREEHRQWNSMFGVGTDGKYFIFLRFRDDKWTDQEPLEVNRYSTERFLWALYNLGQKGKPYKPEYLNGDFGSESQAGLARDGVAVLYEEILKTANPKAQIFFNQWKILFGEVCGYDVENLSDKLKKLAEFYKVKGKTQPAQLLFAVHTYYAILIKLLASDVVSFFYSKFLPRQVERLINATTSAKLKRELEELEHGGVFHTLRVTNFLEGDLFAWYLAVWSEPIENLVRSMVGKLDLYNPGTISEEPAESRDLLKKLYQQLFPKSVRHGLGEYYTPDWLAEHVLNELGYEGDPDKRLLDPACGSGTFLVMAINRIRRWYDLNREKCAYDEGELLKKILANVIGFDLNPLAVMAARTNYLVAIKDLIRHVDNVEIPIFLCDSILTPSQAGSREQQISFLTATGVQYDPSNPPLAVKTAAGIFVVPAEIRSSRDHLGKYAEMMEDSVRNKADAGEFIGRCGEEGLPIFEQDLHRRLYQQLQALDASNQNGIWARIIKNHFAPLFTEKVDYVAGNPPWVRWGYLPSEYRTDMKFLWRHYELFTKKGLESLMGTAELDLSILFTYACLDSYLLADGVLGFLITQEVVRSKGAGEGFRRFYLAPSKTPLKVTGFHDLVALHPFDAANKTGLITISKGQKNKYPVPYIEWGTAKGVKVSSDDSLAEVRAKTVRTIKKASPLNEETSPWQVVTASSAGTLSKLDGESTFKGRCGVSVDPYGVFLCRILSIQRDGSLIVTNDPELGDTDVVQMPPSSIEPDRVFPIVRGRDIRKWHALPTYAAIVINTSTKRDDVPTEKEIRGDLPNTYNYLVAMKEWALRREKFWQFFSRKHLSVEHLSEAKQKSLGTYVRSAGRAESGRYIYEIANGPFFALFNVGPYTFAPFKVAWPMGASRMRAAVLSQFSFDVTRIMHG
ncbi:MAG: N-6 DNA methylase [Terriglobia bacterium]